MYPNISLYLLSKELRRYVPEKTRCMQLKLLSENDFGSSDIGSELGSNIPLTMRS